MNMFNQEVEGFWQVGATKFKNKFQALVFATKTNQEVNYIYFDQIWNNFDRSLLGNVSLKKLYQQRAQQIRDSYDYLILYFSGGADSYNVLRSFIDNNIKLDEVCVKWPMAAIKSQVYKANTLDTSARNTLSEWDFAIKPVLDWLSQYHPQIKINIVDWTDKLSPEIYTEDLWHHVNTWNDIEIPFMLAYSKSELLKLNKGKTVGSIYGIDKPLLAYRDNKWFMSFTDTGTGMGIPSQENRYGTEYFYWSPTFPILAMEQAYQLSLYIDSVPGLKQYYYSSTSVSEWDLDFRMLAIKTQNDVARKILYDNWTNNFQADKPFFADREDKHFWLFNHPELRLVRDSFLDMNSLFLSQLDKRLFFDVERSAIKSDKQRGLYKHIFSKWHFVRLIDE
jgi:hypothetical protein